MRTYSHIESILWGLPDDFLPKIRAVLVDYEDKLQHLQQEINRQQDYCLEEFKKRVAAETALEALKGEKSK